MTPRLLFGLVSFVGLSLVQPAAAQKLFDDESRKNPSHVPLPTLDGDPRKLQEMLAKRLQLQKILNDPELLKLAQEVMKDPRKFGVQDQIDKLLKNPTKPDLNDPAWRDLLGKVLDPNSSPDTPGKNLIPPEKRDALRKALEEAAPPQDQRQTPESPVPGHPNGRPPSAG